MTPVTHYFKRGPGNLPQFIRSQFKLCLFILLVTTRFSTQACSPLNVPWLNSFTINATSVSFSISNTSSWLNCPNVIDVEFACINASFSGQAAATFTSPASTFASSPYTYPVFSISLSNFCPGSAYKFRIRERNNNSTTSSNWSSSSYTLTTPGTFIQPSLLLFSSPNVICPPQSNTLLAQVQNGCGNTNYTYLWSPSTGLNSTTSQSPIATVSAAIAYTAIVTGGSMGCWTVSNSIPLSLGNVPPVAGTINMVPNSICVGKQATLSVAGYSGNIQWQSCANTIGPWNNINGATSPTFITSPLNANICFRASVSNCASITNSVTTNIICVSPNPVPVLTPIPGCIGNFATASFTNFGASGTPISVVWSPPPLSVTNNSTLASYNINGPVSATASFGDGCVSTITINIPVSNLAMTTSSINCNGLGTATATPINIPGPYTFSWTPTGQTSSVATNLFPGNYTVQLGYNSGNCVHTATAYFASLVPYFGGVVNTPSVSCFGASTGSAYISPLSGGTGNTNYAWTNGINTQTTATAYNLGAGAYTVTVTDAVTYCTFSQAFLILQPPPMSLSTSASSPSACVTNTISLHATASGGGSGYTYVWTNGPTASSFVVSPSTGGLHIYTVTATDANNCSMIAQAPVTFVSLPNMAVTNTSICPFETGTITASGANSYQWSTSATGNVLTASPLTTTQYTVVGSTSGCTASATGSIIIKPVPVPTLTSNSPICNGQSLSMQASGGLTYLWSGPQSFTSNFQSPIISPATPLMNGVYTVTLSSLNGCTASISGAMLINPTPTVSASGSTVCVNGVLNVYGNSVFGATFSWLGPNNFSSTQQNPGIQNPLTSATGNYTVVATSAAGCTNTAAAHASVVSQPIPLFTSNSPLCFGQNLILNAGNSVGGISYSWSGPNGFSSNAIIDTVLNVSLASAGIYNLQVTKGPCVVPYSASVTVYALPTPVVTYDGPVCETHKMTFSVTTPASQTIASYAWLGPAGYYSPNQSNTITSITAGQQGIYTAIVTDTYGCKGSASNTFVMLPNPKVTAYGGSVCLNDAATLTAQGATSYNWTGPGLVVTNGPKGVVGAATSTSVVNYYVIGTAANGCTAMATTALSTFSLPVPSFSISPKPEVCLFDNITLTGEGGYYYHWILPGNMTGTGKTHSFTIANKGYEGTYTLVATDLKGCRGIAVGNVTVHSLPSGGLQGKLAGCAPFCTDLSFASPLATSTAIAASWQVNTSNFPGKSFRYCFNQPGTYMVRGRFNDTLTGCSNSSTYAVTAYEVPDADYTWLPEKPIERFDEVILSNQSIGQEQYNWEWFLMSDKLTKTGSQTYYTFDEAGKYPVAMVVRNTWGCVDTVVKVIEVVPDFYVYVPNVFTPNADGKNEVFMPVTRGVGSYKMQLFNRWGQMIFETTDLTKGWNGRYGDNDSPIGQYVYKIEVNSLRGDRRVFNGHFTLYR
jgi:gliding motility-associated-like protein